MNDRNRSLCLLIVLCGALYFPYLGSTPFFDKGEPREALAVQDIVQRGEWLFPLKRATAVPSKPPLFHWSAALVSEITGTMNEVTIRFPSALYATLGVLVVYLLGRKIFGNQVALLGAAILATTSIYADEALNARVDMTLSFFVTLSLVLFYSLYRGFLTGTLWYYALYIVLGVGTLAKGPLGILLPGLVVGTFLVVKKRWDWLARVCFHPGVVLTVILAVGWYGIAVSRGGEGFVDRQLLQENIERFFGGSGHSHPVYYYIPYLFSQGLPWSLFLPFLLWDSFKQGFSSDDDTLFLRLWFLVMFVFFSISVGKRPDYLLPLYPALSLMLGAWFYQQGAAVGRRRLLYRCIAIVAGFSALLLLVISLGAIWNHDSGWFLALIEGLLKEKDRANLVAVRNEIGAFGWSFAVVSLLSAALWIWLGRDLWQGKVRPAAHRLVFISILQAFIIRAMVTPAIAEAKSYRSFMEAVNRHVGANGKLHLYGAFNSDSVVFYHGETIQVLDESPEMIAARAGSGDDYVIMAENDWRRIREINPSLPPPLLESEGKGPEGDTRLILVRAQRSMISMFGSFAP
jgi:4-amino-4-deoxy-L-arabinose transferase-like glycosyltransferase